MIQFLTDFADQAVILPALGLACLVMIISGWRRAALALAGSAMVVAGVIAVGKVSLMACPVLASNPWGLRSPSGHTAMAAMLYGGLAAIMIGGRHPLWRALACAGVAACAAGASRLALGVHSVADVAIGTAIGVAGACAMVLAAGERPSPQTRLAVIVPAAVCVAVLFHGQHMQAESMLERYARQIVPPAMCRLNTA